MGNGTMKSNYVKNLLVRYVLPIMLTIVILSVCFYFQRGIPLISNLANREDTVSVLIIQGDENILLTEAKDIKQAAQVAQMLSYRFGKAETDQIDTMFVFTFIDGSIMELGANSTTVFKNGKRYRGNTDFCKLFNSCTEGIFFFQREAEKENLYQ